MYTHILILAFTVLSLHGSLTSVFADSTVPGATPQERASAGIVTGVDGRVVASPVSSAQTRALRVGDLLQSGDEIRVSAGSRVEVLWNKRVLISLEPSTGVRLFDPTGGQTLVQVLEGQARIAFSYSEGRPTDTLAVITPEARTIMRGGILEVMVGSAVHRTDDQHLLKFDKKEGVREGTTGDVIRIVEGQASIEPALSAAKSFLVKAGHEVRVEMGETDAPHESKSGNRQRLTAIERHLDVPQSAVQRLARTHVDHALELEKSLRKDTENPTDSRNSGGVVTGAVLSTSLGIPVTPFQNSVGPSGQTPSGVSPTVPSATQSGGINSSSLLQKALKNALDKPGKGKGRDKN